MRDINARIKWKDGMDINSDFLNAIEESIETWKAASRRISYGAGLGLLPGTECSVKGAFVKHQFEFTISGLRAVLRSGNVLDIDDRGVVDIDVDADGEYYLTAGIGDNEEEFTSNGVLYVRPEYIYALMDSDHTEDSDVLPLAKFVVQNGTISVVENYIIPCICADSDNNFDVIRNNVAEQLNLIAEHKNLEEGDGKRAVLEMLFRLKYADRRISVDKLLEMLREAAGVVDYFIMKRHSEQVETIPSIRRIDIRRWTDWLTDYLNNAMTILDAVVLENHEIDYEKLKSDLREEILAEVKEELQERINTSVDELGKVIRQDIEESTRNYVDVEFRENLRTDLFDDLQEKLRHNLYDSLFEDLYGALYVEDEKNDEDEYMPLI